MIPPDPVLAASLFHEGGLDAVVHGVAAPWLARLRERTPGAAWALWMVRYARRGPHLKLRLHGPEEHRQTAAALLEEEAASFFVSLPPRDPAAPRTGRPGSPAVDPEDAAEGEHPDRALAWTRPGRSPVNLGPPELLGDDGYVARMAAALARGGERSREAVAPGMAEGRRLKALLAGVAEGLEALGWEEETRGAYLAYHRDWLLRFFLASAAKEAEAVAVFEGRVEAMRGTVARVRAEAAGGAADDGWGASLAELAAYLEPRRGEGAFRPDPFTEEPAWPSLFKAFHGLANQLGVDMRNEAYVHHLLLATAAVPAGAAAGA